ncbi:cyclase family protein [Thermostilla marina]
MRRIIDLTLPIKPGMRGFSPEVASRIIPDGWNATNYTIYSHCGTHMDAPCHFVEGAASIDSVSLEACIGNAVLVDVTPVEPKESIGPERLATAADRITPGSRVILRTDWHRRVGSPEYRDALPRVSRELAEWFVERKLALLGVEPPSVADVHNIEEVTAVHQVLLKAGIVIVEGLAHLDEIPGDTFELIVLPLRIPEGDGSPVRALALVDD